MSLYEQFFSDINKEFMFNMANNVLKKDHNVDIDGDESIKETYLQDMKNIFENNDFVDISDINKVLLDTTIHKNKNINNIGLENEKDKEEEKTTDTKDKDVFSGYRKIDEDFTDKSKRLLSDIIKEREEIDNSFQNDKNEEGEKGETNINSLLKNVQGTKIEELIDNNENDVSEVEVDVIDDLIKEPETIIQQTPILKEEPIKNLKLVSFSSNKRTSINSSRYNYSVDIIKEDFQPEKLHSISRLIIPIEENYIFTLPILTLIIKELDVKVCMQQKDIIKNDFNTVGVYEPIENILFDISFPLRKLSIDIRDTSSTKYSSNDILKINIMEIKKNILIFTCSKIDKRNFKVNDMIKIININTYDMYIVELLSNPLKIKAIKENMIFCKIDDLHEDRVFNNIDMKILNISNQNMIYFNQYS